MPYVTRRAGMVTIEAEPTPQSIDLDKTALVIIDMQRDFLEPGGFGAALGNDVTRLQAAVEPCRAVLSGAAIRRCASARKGRWGASSFAASPATTSSPSSIRSPASR